MGTHILISLMASYTPLESEARRFIEDKLGIELDEDTHEALKSGVVLCNLLNELEPGKIAKISNKRMAFMQMENIAAFCEGADPSALREDEEDFNREKDVSRLGGARRAGQLDADLRDRGVVSICPKCNLPVSSGAVYALDETWHPKCFTCKKCDKKLGATTFYEHEDKAYCDICILRVK